MQIIKMTLIEFEKIKDNLTVDFDEFWTAKNLKDELQRDDRVYYCLECNNEIYGFIGAMKNIDELEIMNVVVKRSQRNKGFAGQLLNEIVTYAKENNYKKIWLEVNENNKYAIKLYIKNGFESVSIRKNYYNNTENAVIMCKKML